MKKFRIVYQFSSSIISEQYVRATDKQEALEKVKAVIGEKRVISIEEALN